MPTRHHLLTVTYWLLRAGMVLSVLVMLALVLGMGVLGAVALHLAGRHLPIPPALASFSLSQLLAMVGLLVVLLLVSFAILALAFHATGRIVETAMFGDPFVNENARRLMLLGWLLLALQGIGMVADMAVAGWAQKLVAHLPAGEQPPPGDLGDISIGFGPSLVGLLAVLLIFVLAQIFRRGSEMRAELEGTV